MLDNNVVNGMCDPAIQVCQWHKRAVDGSLFTCAFWYNSGGLKGDELLEQFNQVVMRCETIGFRVLGFVCDAGGPNTRLMKLLCIELPTKVQQFPQKWEATMKDDSNVLHPGIHVKDGLMIANFIQEGASTGDAGRVGEVQVSPMRAHAGSNQ